MCVPGLHISLGLFLKHYISFEEACNKLDLEIARMMTSDECVAGGSIFTSSFKTILQTIQKAKDLQIKAEAFKQNSTALQQQMTALRASCEPDDPALLFLADTLADSQAEHDKLVSLLKQLKCCLYCSFWCDDNLQNFHCSTILRCQIQQQSSTKFPRNLWQGKDHSHQR